MPHSYIQSILFNKTSFDKKKAEQWIKKHNFIPIKELHETNKYLRYRLQIPNKKHFYVTKKITEYITFIIGYPENYIPPSKSNSKNNPKKNSKKNK